MIQKNFDDITKADIDFLIDSKISEIKTLEYKEKLPGSQDSDKKEFLADIASFANASGGDVIYGIKGARNSAGKKTGEPKMVVPLEDITADDAKLQIENLVRTGIEPRIPIRVKAIKGYGSDQKGFIILVRISQSFASPHMVKFKNTSRFYCRNSAGKYQLDYHEIKNIFLATDSQAERVRNFLQNRLAKIIANETPMIVFKPYRLVLHIIPLSSFLNQKRIDLQRIDSNNEYTLMPIGASVSACKCKYNIDGIITYLPVQSESQPRTCDSYCQTFFNGAIEAVCVKIFRTKSGDYPQNTKDGLIGSPYFEELVVTAMQNYIKAYKVLDINPPIIVSLALLGCKGVFMSMNFDSKDGEPLDCDPAIFPDIQINSFDETIPTVMRSTFDAVCNAFGFPYSFNYTENGIWNVRSF
jgi:hypothetical protein